MSSARSRDGSRWNWRRSRPSSRTEAMSDRPAAEVAGQRDGASLRSVVADQAEAGAYVLQRQLVAVRRC
jgi:hypothetical protein